jgi:hypothetical protein
LLTSARGRGYHRSAYEPGKTPGHVAGRRRAWPRGSADAGS